MEPTDLPADLLEAAPAAKIAKCQLVAIHRWVRRGLIRGWRRAGRLFVSEAEVRGMFVPVVSVPAKQLADRQVKHSRVIAQGAAEQELRAAGWMV